MQHAPFVHLHVHTYYSLLDGAIPIEKLAEVAKRFRLPAVAMTDHGNMFGAVEFYKKISAEGIKPILGCELYLLTKGSRKDKTVKKDGGFLSHLTALVKNQKGYQNLCRLISSSHLEGFYYKPRIDKEILEQNNEGLIFLSGCLKGEVARLILNDDMNGAEEAARWYSQLFGEERFYLEVMDIGLPEQEKANAGLIEIGKKLGLPLVATNDCHYVTRDDVEAHEALLCIQTGKTLSDEKRMRFGGDAFYIKSPEEMSKSFAHVPEAVSNTVKIAERCNFEFDFKTYHFPKFEPPEGMDLPTYLAKNVEDGFLKRVPLLQTRYGAKWTEVEGKYRARVEEELTLIKKMGFAGYFLIVADFIDHAKKEGVAVGPGRGSAAGSLVAYALGITDIDPIPYHLLFERFLNPERISMPDMDIDFCMLKREKVIEYVTAKYGNVSQIITFGKMKARAVVRDVGRVMGVPYGDVDRIAKLIPTTLGITLEKALQVEPQLRELFDKDPQVAKLLDIARRLEGFPRHASTHAAGVVISDQPLVNFLPLYRGQADEVITQFDMKSVESIGLIKFDFLGLRTLTLIEDAVRIIKEMRGEDVNIETIPLDDKAVYENLASGNTKGVFQLESSGMTDLIVRLKPSIFEEIIALVALFRPGPLGSGMVDDFIDRKHGRKQIKYELPRLEPILKDTYGVILYQEQVMQVASALANFSLGDADILRRAMGKKKAKEMDQQREKFLKGCAANKIPQAKAEHIFDLMAKFAEYGFNKSHSAAYAMVAYRTAYLKTHYLTEFMAALLTSEMGDTEKVLEYMNNCKDHGIKILPPDINQSEMNFTVVQPVIASESDCHSSEVCHSRESGNPSPTPTCHSRESGNPSSATTCHSRESGNPSPTPIVIASAAKQSSARSSMIRFGLAAVKNVGEAAIESILEVRREKGNFTSLSQLCQAVDTRKVNHRVLESLIKCGAMDSFGPSTGSGRCKSRAELFASLTAAMEYGAARQRDKEVGQSSMFDILSTDDDSEKYIAKNAVPAEKWSEHQSLSYEKEALGFYLTGHPLAQYEALISQYTQDSIKTITQLKTKREVRFAGVVAAMRETMTRQGKKMAFVTLEDLTGTIEAIVFSDVYNNSVQFLKGEHPLFFVATSEAGEETAKVLVKEIFPIQDLPVRLTKSVHFHLSAAETNESHLKQLKSILARYPGKCPAYIHLSIPDKSETLMELPQTLNLSPNLELVKSLEKLFGHNVTQFRT